MSENKCCGNCKHFKDEDAKGYGCCEKLKQATYCSFKCYHQLDRNTPDNIDEIDEQEDKQEDR